MKSPLPKVGIGIQVGIVVFLLLLGCTALFTQNRYSPPYARLYANSSYANVTLYSGSRSELRHSFQLTFLQNVGYPRYCAEENDDICVQWDLALLLVSSRSRNGMRRVTILTSQVPLNVCFPLKGYQLYGGPVMLRYPSQRVNFTDIPYVTGYLVEKGNLAVLERYWFTSGGFNIHVAPDVPLFISQNKTELCLSAKNEFPYSEDVAVKISYTTCGNTSNAKEAVKCFFPSYQKPILPTKVIAYPIWSTWVEFKTFVDQNKVLQFESNIRKYGFNASIIEIDDGWESCYGAQTFDLNKFPDSKAMVDQLHSFGRLVTLWVHPFLGSECPSDLFDSYKQYLVTFSNGSVGMTDWWNGVGALFNFLNPDTTKWYADRLHNRKSVYGVDGFKADGGEAVFFPEMKENISILLQPNMFTTNFVNMSSQFGTFTDVRVGSESFQFKLMQRLQDTNSVWDSEKKGLRSVIKSVLQLSLIGYGAILPDMIGGNHYNNSPSKELFIRWVQVNTFLPIMQFSLSPWSFDEETVNITKKFTSLHYDYTKRFLKEFKDPHQPVINPIWWISPEDKIAQVTSSEFLLGVDLLVAPVMKENATTRNIYLPKGSWRDKNNGEVYQGPITLKNYPAPLEVLPYFERISNN